MSKCTWFAPATGTQLNQITDGNVANNNCDYLGADHFVLGNALRLRHCQIRATNMEKARNTVIQNTSLGVSVIRDYGWSDDPSGHFSGGHVWMLQGFES